MTVGVRPEDDAGSGDGGHATANITIRLDVDHLLMILHRLVQRFVARAVEFGMAGLPLRLLGRATQLRDIHDRTAQFGFLNFIQIQISRHGLRERGHRTMH